MRAELAWIVEPDERRRFARSAALAACLRGAGVCIACGLIAPVLVAAIATAASRMQLAAGGPGILPVTVLVPSLLLLVVALVASRVMMSFRVGVLVGFCALAASTLALWVVLAVEGMVWMERRGVFLLDGDPPHSVADRTDVVLDIFTTGMWIGHATFWVSAVLAGAAIGIMIGGLRAPSTTQR